MGSLMRLLAVSTLLFVPPTSGRAIEFVPHEGAVVRKTFTSELDLSSDSVDFYFEDERLDEDEIGEVELLVTFRREVSVLDTQERVRDGRLARWSRVIETAQETTEESFAVGDQEGRLEYERGSDYTDLPIQCRWDEDEEPEGVDEYGDSVDAAAELELAGLVPDGDVEEGDTWTPAATALSPLFRQAGEHWSEEFEIEGDEDLPAETPLLFARLFGELPEGELEAEWTETLERGGERLALIELSAELTLEHYDYEEAEGGGEDSIDLTLELELEGTVLWSLDRGGLVELELEGDAELTMEAESILESEGRDFSMSQRVRYSGDVSFTAMHERAED